MSKRTLIRKLRSFWYKKIIFFPVGMWILLIGLAIAIPFKASKDLQVTGAFIEACTLTVVGLLTVILGIFEDTKKVVEQMPRKENDKKDIKSTKKDI